MDYQRLVGLIALVLAIADSIVLCQVQLPIAITIRPSDGTVVKLGESLTVQCNYSQAQGHVPIIMQFNGQLLVASETYVQDAKMSTLTIRSFSSSNSGQYTCRYQSFTEAVASPTISVQLAVAPRIEKPTATTILANASQAWQIMCRGSGVPLPDWELLRGSQVIDRQSARAQLVYTGRSATPSDAGPYMCRARNFAGVDNYSLAVVVQTPPSATVPGAGTAAAIPIGRTLSLSCVADGLPVPDVRWLHDGIYIDQQSNSSARVAETNLTAGSVRSTLTVDRVVRNDAGIYLCSAANLLGQQSAGRTVVVQVPPTAPSGVTFTSVQHTSAVVRWTAPVEDGFAPIHAYFVSVLKVQSASSPRSVHRATASPVLELPLTGLDPNAAYSVSVSAENLIDEGPSSPEANFTTLPLGPPSPTIRAITPRPTGFLIEWALDKQWRPEQGSLRYFSILVEHTFKFIIPNISAARRSYNVSGLAKATRYSVTLLSHNRAHASPSADSIRHVVTTATKPSSPVWEDAVGVSMSGVSLVWSEPLDNGGRPRTHYILTWVSDPSSAEFLTIDANAVSRTVSGLLPDTTYTFTISAINELGPSESVSITAKTLERNGELLPVPALPSILTRSSRSLLIGLPVDSLNALAKQWLLQYRQSGTTVWRQVSLERGKASYCLDVLQSDVGYEVRLAQAAQEHVGRSFFSPALAASTLAPGALPDVMIVSIFSESIVLGRVHCGVDTSVNLQLEFLSSMSNSGWKVLEVSQGGSSVTVNGLQSNETYSFRHVLVNADGTRSAVSSLANATTLHRPQLQKRKSTSTGVIVAAVVSSLVVIVMVAVLVYILAAPHRRRRDNKSEEICAYPNNNKPSLYDSTDGRETPVDFNNCHPQEEICASSSRAESPAPEQKLTQPEPLVAPLTAPLTAQSSRESNYAKLELLTPTTTTVRRSSEMAPNEYSAIDREATKRAQGARVDFHSARQISFPDNEAERMEHSTV
ncbi:protein sidekick-1-like [Sycon ciliatum]|uniref:protein sidekick-1-like n=1 Tax=Sycon ciliatum TaxID=27933 RepID=UPI0031F649DC